MGAVGRGIKTNGTTDWADGDTIYAAEHNTDLNTLYTLVNGDIDDANVDASANIDPAKLGDYSATDTEMRTMTPPGVSNSENLATTIEGEISNLRYAIWQHKIGTTAEHNDGTQKGMYWGDEPVRGDNLCRNNSFELKSSATAGDAPDGWTAIGPPTSCTLVDTTPGTGVSDGKLVRITAAAGGDGISQSFAGLKPSTLYYVSARARVVGADTLTISTTGATGAGAFRNMSKAVTSTSFAQYAGVVQTDATPTAIVLRFILSAAGDICEIDDVQFREVNANVVSRAGYLAVSDASTTSEALSTSMADRPSGDIVTAGLTVPGPGYTIRVSAHGSFTCSDAVNRSVYMQIVQNDGSTDTTVAGPTGSGTGSININNPVAGIHLDRVITNPTPGLTYTYRIQAAGTANTFINGGPNPGGGVLTMESRINVELIPPG